MDRTTFIKGPVPTLELAYSDVWLSALYSRRMLLFEIPTGSSHEKAIEILERALQCLVDGTPELGSLSVVVPEADHDGKTPWRALAPYDGIEFIVKDFTDSFASFADIRSQGFPVNQFKDDQFMPISFRMEPGSQPQAKIQASLIPGGLLLSICILHHLSDGNGMNTITRALRQACQRASDTSGPLPAVILNTDRTLMHSLHGTQTDLVHHPAHRHVPDAYRPKTALPPEDVPSPNPTSHVVTPIIFNLPSSNALRLKAASADPTMPLISTHDAIAALLWRTVTLARLATGRLTPTDTTTFAFPVNARRHLGLPPDWVGNCVYFCGVQRLVSDFLPDSDANASTDVIAAEKVVRETTALIHFSRAAIDASRVQGIMTARRADPFAVKFWPVFKFADPSVFGITSFYHSGMLEEDDWGSALGMVRHFATTDAGPLAAGLERGSWVGPKVKGGKGCDVGLGLDQQELEFFERDELWKTYCTVRGG